MIINQIIIYNWCEHNLMQHCSYVKIYLFEVCFTAVLEYLIIGFGIDVLALCQF
jgi:hypothetical protein